jgi:putative hydrolase of the HAD superfamily
MSKTVIFDIGGVYFCDGTQIAIGSIASRYKIKPEMVANILNGDAGGKYRTGMITAEEFWNQAGRHWNLASTPEELSAIWHQSYQPDDGTVRLIERLKKADHQLLYFSNNTGEKVAYLDKKYRFLDKFDDGIFSHLVKRRKPDPVIYQLILAKASHAADACIYIDDKPHFLKPAQDLGMTVIAFKNSSQLEDELKALSLFPEGH